MTHHQLAHVFLAGLFSLVGWFVLLAIGWLIAKLTEWTDDFERKYPNPILYLFASAQGWSYEPHGYFPYKRTDDDGDIDSSDGEPVIIQGMIAAPLLGVLAAATYYQVAIGITVAVAVLALFTMRFVKRLKKKFELHTADKNAHK